MVMGKPKSSTGKGKRRTLRKLQPAAITQATFEELAVNTRFKDKLGNRYLKVNNMWDKPMHGRLVNSIALSPGEVSTGNSVEQWFTGDTFCFTGNETVEYNEVYHL